ncbi:MAG: TrlF family AAA-like ATPase [Desulfomonilaceae bacterium]
MEPLLEKISKVRDSAARFYAVDLHVHSPCSYDWDNCGPTEGSRDSTLDRIPIGGQIPEESVVAYRTAISPSKRSLVAITDHNRSCFAEAVAAKNKDSELCVLPGIELTVTLNKAPLIRDVRIHVLAIFPEDTHHEAIARVLPSGTGPEDKRDPHQMFCYESADALISCIRAEGGLAIAAHIEGANGLRGVYKNTAELLLEPIGGSPEAQQVLRMLGDQVKDELAKFDAIQVRPTTDTIHYKGPEGNLRVPLIVASDCHKVTELAEPHDAKYSYVKMAVPSFEGLCQALKFPDLRVRFATGLPQAAPPRLLGLRIVGHKGSDNTFFNDTVLGFSDNLTCLIGPRGSGKSAVIDGLRYLMGYNRTLDQIRKVSDQVVERQRHTLEKSRIEALYLTGDRHTYKLMATYDSRESYVTEVYDMDGNSLNIEDVSASGEFPLNLFGWGELELLAENPETQRELLDRFIPEVAALKDAKSDVLLKLERNRQACIEKASEMDGYFSDIALDFLRLEEFKTEYDKLNTEEIEAVFSKMDSIRAKRRILNNIRQELRQHLDEGDISSSLELSRYFDDDTLKEWAEAFCEQLKPDQIDAWMLEVNRQHESKIKAAMDIVAVEDGRLARQEDAAEKEIQAVIGEDQAITGDLRNRAKLRYEAASSNRNQYAQIHDELENLFSARNTLLGELDDCDKLIFATRNKETTRISEQISIVEDDGYQIDLVLTQQADRRTFLSALPNCGLSFYGNWKAAKRPEIIAEKLTPQTVAQAIMSGDVGAFDGLCARIDSQDYAMRKVDAEHLVADNRPFSELEGLGMRRFDPTKLDIILRIQEIPVDDDFFIRLGGKPIQYCSPGQRCSAMLPLVTLTSQAPLIIDQPEDNLDNRLVSRALFKILARLKETRQIILATHNPNILVSGDAEQVLLLDADGNLENYGCIDNPAIIESILSLMEGGAEAFLRRQTKYERFL